MACAPAGPWSRPEHARAWTPLHSWLSNRDHAGQVTAGVSVDRAGLNHELALTEFADHVQVMRGHNDRDAHIGEAPEQFHDLQREVRVEVAGRLVSDQKWWLAHNRAGNPNTLLFAHGQLHGRE